MIGTTGMGTSANGCWVSQSLEQLLELQNSDFGWGYRNGGASAVEPTVLACLALQVHCRNQDLTISETANQGARWLAKIQHPDGALGVTGYLSAPRWPTAYGLLVWTILPDFQFPARKALTWLLNQKGG